MSSNYNNETKENQQNNKTNETQQNGINQIPLATVSTLPQDVVAIQLKRQMNADPILYHMIMNAKFPGRRILNIFTELILRSLL